MSRSRGRSSLHEARYAAQLIYLMICICLPYVPQWRLTSMWWHLSPLHMFFWCVWGSRSPPKPCEKRHNVRMQLSQPVFWDDGVFHTVADILSQSHWWWTSMACLECFTMRRFYHHALVTTSEVVSDLDDTIFEAERFVKRVLISIFTGSHY